ncbi:helix-turn-helix domain-containing protein [Pandoraea faecigallinarum]|uniref:helix-turn-helix domain-containing protein n=1 Tax=Pandoraea faecigallinarum TaxID=656179 RepID=UPI000A05E7E3
MQTNPLALFGDHLARLRKARGWSQEKLALESGLARSYVSGIERGRRNVALVNICVLADTLGVPTSEMLRFAPNAAGAEDAAAPSARTPLPQISRSLCKLENRDQVWLAEIIRSLSSRLSHAAPPGTGGACASTSTHAAALLEDGGGADGDEGADGRDGARETRDEIRDEVRDESVCEAYDGRSPRCLNGSRDAEDVDVPGAAHQPPPAIGDPVRESGVPMATARPRAPDDAVRDAARRWHANDDE